MQIKTIDNQFTKKPNTKPNCLKCGHVTICAIYRAVKPLMGNWESDKPFEAEDLANMCNMYAEEFIQIRKKTNVKKYKEEVWKYSECKECKKVIIITYQHKHKKYCSKKCQHRCNYKKRRTMVLAYLEAYRQGKKEEFMKQIKQEEEYQKSLPPDELLKYLGLKKKV